MRLANPVLLRLRSLRLANRVTGAPRGRHIDSGTYGKPRQSVAPPPQRISFVSLARKRTIE
jgi:hypothetical protein